MQKLICRWLKAIPVFVCLVVLSSGAIPLRAQQAANGPDQSSGSIQGTVVDPRGQVVQGASVTIQSTSGEQERKTATDNQGKFSVSGLADGKYTVQVSAPGFGIKTNDKVKVSGGSAASVSISLSVASVAEEVTVEAEEVTSIAAELAPVKTLLDAASARTEITSTYVSEFTSPVTDYADIIQAAPGTVSYTTNGIGNGDAKIFFRGFVDADYTLTWDGVPFNDSNDPTHHSWAYIPAAGVGYVDFDRSPGTASDIGTSNFGGSIHFFSPHLGDQPHIRIQETHGSWNTNQILGDINSGAFLKGKAHFWLNADYQNSDGYQTYASKRNVAATAKFDYKFSDRTQLTVAGSNIIIDAFTNNDPSRRQLFHHGDNYLYDANQLNADGTYNANYYRFSVYHVPSFFDIITFNHDFGKGWKLDSKSYTYGYSNHQHYQNTTDNDQITDSVLTAPIEEAVGGDDQPTSSVNYDKKPTGVDKLNQYARGGEIAALSYATKWGVFRAGNWYEYTNTTRYQIYTDPITWVDSPYVGNIKFHEHFYTYAVQPYAEFQLVAIPKWTITAGVKDAYFLMSLTQWADGKTIGPLTCAKTTLASACTATVQHSQGYNSILPSFEANYRVNNLWSVYGQYGRGSIAPFSNVFDKTGAQVAVTPPPTIADTYQGGTVVKLNRFAFDADAYHIHFTNTYSTYTPSSGPDQNFTYYYANPDSNTNGFEAEGNYALTNSLSINANGTFGIAKYEAAAAKAAVTDAGGNIINPATPATPAAWVATAPHDTESIGLTYHEKGLDLGVFGKRVGSRWDDIGSNHQVVPYDPFWMSNLFVNYSIKGNSIFAGSKIKFSVNNLFDSHDIVSIGAANDCSTLASPYETCTTNPGNAVSQNLQLYTPSWNDSIKKQAGRAIMISFQLGLSPKKK